MNGPEEETVINSEESMFGKIWLIAQFMIFGAIKIEIIDRHTQINNIKD